MPPSTCALMMVFSRSAPTLYLLCLHAPKETRTDSLFVCSLGITTGLSTSWFKSIKTTSTNLSILLPMNKRSNKMKTCSKLLVSSIVDGSSKSFSEITFGALSFLRLPSPLTSSLTLPRCCRRCCCRSSFAVSSSTSIKLIRLGR